MVKLMIQTASSKWWLPLIVDQICENSVSSLSLNMFDYELPEELIALRPLAERGFGRLMVGDPQSGIVSSSVSKLPQFLSEGDLLVFNNTQVIPARLRGHKAGEGQFGAVELLLLHPESDDGSFTSHTEWRAMGRPLKKLHPGQELNFNGLLAKVIKKVDGQHLTVGFSWSDDGWLADLVKHGAMPLPPYIEKKRPADDQDKQDYQPLLAKVPGAVASPTASLHFDETLMEQLQQRGIQRAEVTLHVGAGTFLPVQSEQLEQHVMHKEWGAISENTMQHIHETKKQGGRVVAVGTTVMRILETVFRQNPCPKSFQGYTDIFLKPGSSFYVCDGLVTNFHLPRSTLLMLVSAFSGSEFMRALYQRAIEEKYRFFSYGDASLLFRDRSMPWGR
jgi:S-adenosylmethionine:tRNA ribosyltransferase-isomerase